jgi:hypothetical protein
MKTFTMMMHLYLLNQSRDHQRREEDKEIDIFFIALDEEAAIVMVGLGSPHRNPL